MTDIASVSLDQPLANIADELGCSEVWVLTERDNSAAMSLYTSIPGSQAKETVMFTFPVHRGEETI